MSSGPTIALCMIVRDEGAVIERCVASVRELVSTWTICDTGSTDDTCARVERALAGIPGTLHHRPWRDFAHNRSEALALARGTADYLLLLDADMTLRVLAPLTSLEADAYLVRAAGDLDYATPRLVRGDRAWRFEGAVHEYLTADEPSTQAPLAALEIEHHADGGARADKLERDLLALERRLAQEPGDLRALFYLAQTHRDAERPAQAREAYRRRAEAGGWDEERYYAAFQHGVLLAQVDPVAGVRALAHAAGLRPSRAEALHAAAQVCRMQGWHDAAYAFAGRGLAVAYPDDLLFVHRDVHRFGLRLERSIAAYWTGRPREALSLGDALLEVGDLPDEVERDVRENRRFAEEALARERVGTRAAGWSSPPRLEDLAPSVRLGEILLDVEPDWPLSNPSVLADGDGFLVNIRSVNYRLEDHGYEFLEDDRRIRTLNYLARLDGGLRVTGVDAMADHTVRSGARTGDVLGFEDLRLFRAGGVLHATAVAQDLTPSGLPLVYLLTFDGPRLVRAHRLPGEPGRAEKNWVPLSATDTTVDLLYTPSPTTVVTCDLARGTILRRGARAAAPWTTTLRGGSQAVAVPGGGELLIVHEVLRGPVLGRRYVHRFVLLDDERRIAAASPGFSFTGEPIEFCAGLATRGDDLVASFGVRDRTAALAVVALSEVLATLVTVGSSVPHTAGIR